MLQDIYSQRIWGLESFKAEVDKLCIILKGMEETYESLTRTLGEQCDAWDEIKLNAIRGL